MDVILDNISHRIALYQARKKHRNQGKEVTHDWWFASIAIPLLAATVGPFANVLSIAALVGYWREDLYNGPGQALKPQLGGDPFKDPRWVTGLNAASLVTGYVGNFFLFVNFTKRIRYSIALPVTIILWFISAFILIGITIALSVVAPPVRPLQTYTQAFWYAVISAVLYFLCSVLLMINMLGYFLGHYEKDFNLTDAQRTLILQTFLFFIWLAGGAGMFTAVDDWDYSTALYYCDVTILTIGFGDVTPHNAAGRGLMIPYALGGIVFLGLMISSISSTVSDLGHAKIVRARFEKQRVRTLDRSNTLRLEQSRQLGRPSLAESLSRSGGGRRSVGINLAEPNQTRMSNHIRFPRLPNLREGPKQKQRRLSLGLLREEKDRFEAMRRIQKENAKFKKYTTLTFSLISFIVLWLVGALVFWQVEKNQSESSINTFFDGFYFCYVSLITIGYGDYTPSSSAGRPFFVVWSLFAVPSVTVLVSAAGNTVIDTFNRQTNKVAEFTLLPKHGVYRDFLEKWFPWLLVTLQQRAEKKAEEERLEEGFKVGPEEVEEEQFEPQSLEDLAAEESKPPDEHALARSLALAIRLTADDLKHDQNKRYDYEEWAKFTELIKFTSRLREENDDDDDPLEEAGLIDWDWIGEDSPMMAEQSEPEWLLDRLCESMTRYIKHQAPAVSRKSFDLHQKTGGDDTTSSDETHLDAGVWRKEPLRTLPIEDEKAPGEKD